MRPALVSVLVRAYDEAIAWYGSILHLRLAEDTDLGNGKRWVIMEGEGASRLLLAKAADARQAAAVGDQAGGRVFLFFETDDFDRDHARMTAFGVEFEEAPRDEPYGRVAVFRDLYGNRCDLVEPSRPAA